MTAEPIPTPPPDDGRPAELHSLLELMSDMRGRVYRADQIPPHVREAIARLRAGAPVLGGQLRLMGKARKVSVSLPEDLTSAVQQRVGPGAFSQYVTAAVSRQLELDLLGELIEMLEEEHGPISDEALAEARHSWPDMR